MNHKKILGAVLAGLSVILYYIILIGIVVSTGELFDSPIFLILLLLLGIPLFGITLSLILRIQEIKGGEEEEAKKY